MITILYRDQIDHRVWDSFIERSIQRNLYALSWFLDLMPKRWGAVIEFDSALNYVSALPFQIKTKYGITVVDQEPAVAQLGFYSLSENFSEELLSVLKKEFRYISRYYFNTKNDLRCFPMTDAQATYQLDLAPSYETLFNGYHIKRKKRLKQAKTKTQYVIDSDQIDPLITIFKENVAHKIYGLRDYQYELVKKIYLETRKRNISFILQVRSEKDEVLASGLFIKYFNQLIYFFGASTKEGRKNFSQLLLFDYVIQKFSGTFLTLDSHGGGSIDRLDQFYSGFGATPLLIHSLHQKRVPLVLKSFLTFRSKVVKHAVQFFKRRG